MVKLYRATSSGYTGPWSCWAESRQAAEAYTNNPGFGGSRIITASVPDDASVLDLTGSAATNVLAAMRTLAHALYEGDAATEAYEEWTTSGYDYVYHVWQEGKHVRAALAARYDWVRYADDYPASAITWLRVRT